MMLAALLPALLAPAAVLDIDGAESTSIGIYIKDLKTGRVLVDHNSSLALTPASVMKVITSATAMEMLGPDFRFVPHPGLAGRRDPRKRSRWEGDLVVRGSGDPTLGSDRFKEALGMADSIAAALRRMGIGEISGTVVIEESMADAGPVPTWEVEDIAWPYGAGLYGFNYAGNTVAALPAKGITRPASSLKIRLLPAAKGQKGIDVARGAEADNLVVRAPKAKRKPDWSVNVSVPDPAGVFAGVLRGKLRAAGIAIGSRAAGASRASLTDVYAHRSPLAADILRDLMKRSDNLFAEGMLRAIDPEGTRGDCIDAERDHWADRGISPRFTIIRDGSGLSRSNRLSARFISDVLETMAGGQRASTWVDFFPVAGVDGTLKSFGKKTRLNGRLAMKTGSVAAVQAYAGYRLDWEGRPTHTVVVIVNGFFCPRARVRGAIEKMLLNTFAN